MRAKLEILFTDEKNVERRITVPFECNHESFVDINKFLKDKQCRCKVIR